MIGCAAITVLHATFPQQSSRENISKQQYYEASLQYAEDSRDLQQEIVYQNDYIIQLMTE